MTHRVDRRLSRQQGALCRKRANARSGRVCGTRSTQGRRHGHDQTCPVSLIARRREMGSLTDKCGPRAPPPTRSSRLHIRPVSQRTACRWARYPRSCRMCPCLRTQCMLHDATRCDHTRARTALKRCVKAAADSGSATAAMLVGGIPAPEQPGDAVARWRKLAAAGGLARARWPLSTCA